MKTGAGAIAAALVVLGAGVAAADPIIGTNDPPADPTSERGKYPRQRREQAERWRPGFGARVGGYGFRNPDGDGAWDTCRMNGFGVFGTLDVNRHLFGELSLDLYSATPETVDQGLDRTSTHVLTGVGLRMLPYFVLSPYVMLGGGAEYTRVELPQGNLEALYPMGFIGLGAELNVTRELKLGATVRMLATARPVLVAGSAAGGVYGGSESALTGEARPDPEMELDLASQGQFFLRYTL